VSGAPPNVTLFFAASASSSRASEPEIAMTFSE